MIFPIENLERVTLEQKNGEAEGVMRWYWENGNLQVEMPYKNGKTDGIVRSFFKNGNLQIEVLYRNGKKEGIMKWYWENGNLQSETPFKNGKKEGIEKRYFKNGKLQRETPYKSGEKEGIEKLYLSSGSLRYEISHNTKEEIRKKYHRDGSLMCEKSYKEWRKMRNRISNRLAKWREERRLTIEGQRKGLQNNLIEEWNELLSAIKKENKLEIIDALCDMSVLSLNAGAKWIDTSFEKTNEMLVDSWDIFLEDMRIFIYDEELNAINQVALTKIYTLGYDPYKCLLETIKEIESRVGAWCEESKKWIKDTSPEAQAKWYKADYSKCKMHQ